MTRLSRGDLIEAAFWLGFAALAYSFSFRFDQAIEIYKFGAAAWPRVIILLIVVAALCQLYTAARGDDDSPLIELDEERVVRSTADYWRILAILALPIIYASLLDISGFYFTTPIFILLYLLVNGERRLLQLIGVTLFIYVFILIVFTKLLYVGLPIGYAHPFYEFSNWLLVLIR